MECGLRGIEWSEDGWRADDNRADETREDPDDPEPDDPLDDAPPGVAGGGGGGGGEMSVAQDSGVDEEESDDADGVFPCLRYGCTESGVAAVQSTAGFSREASSRLRVAPRLSVTCCL